MNKSSSEEEWVWITSEPLDPLGSIIACLLGDETVRYWLMTYAVPAPMPVILF